ncbi:MAG: PQQ-binding-like beta-propeller repeat protein [Proteobacteria bacterium]|nr:PQQ-binding-like beta-propeller repeat protein [Pseudomonadota bacterium]
MTARDPEAMLDHWRRAAGAVLVAALMITGLEGCAGPRGLRELAPVPDSTQLARALAPFGSGLRASPLAAKAPTVWLVAQAPLRLAAYDLRRRSFRFIVRADVASRVVVGGAFGACALDEGRSLAAFDSEHGRLLWRTPAPQSGWRVLGLAASGSLVFAVWGRRAAHRAPRSSAAATPQAALVAYDGRSGERRWAVPSWVPIGAPRAWGDYLVLPTQRQGLALLEGRSGDVLVQLPWRGEAISWIEANRDGVYFGGRASVKRLAPGIGAGADGAAGAAPVVPPVITGIAPSWGRDSYDGAPWDYGAGDRQRWLWRRPTGSRPAASGWADDRLLLLHYRFLLGFAVEGARPQRPQLAWVRRATRGDFVAATHTGRAVMLVGAGGELLVVDPRTGAERERSELGLRVWGATFDAEGFGDVQPAAPPAAAAALRDALMGALLEPDRRFPGLARFFVSSLAASAGPPPTAALLRLAREPLVTQEVRDQALDYLNEHPDERASELYLSLLAERNDQVLGTHAASLEPAARAAAALRLPEAVRPLLLQLADPQTPLPALAAVVDALWAIGDRRAMEPLRELLLTYRCEPELGWAPRILAAAAAAVMEWGGRTERELVDFVAHDPHTLPALRQRLDRLLEAAEESERRP